MGKLKILKFSQVTFVLINFLSLSTLAIEAIQCKGREFVYDLTPQGEYVKNTMRVLVDQGLSNKTSVIYAKLGGLWTAKRADFLESGWKCGPNKTFLTTVVELSGLSLEVVEKVDTPIHRSHHKIAQHKPCRTFDLPLWMCRQSKPIYRTTKTWVNRAYFNLTLAQKAGQRKPIVSKLSMIFTCPETFRQKITYSPSAVYILSKFLHTPATSPDAPAKVAMTKNKRDVNSTTVEEITNPPSAISPITEPGSYSSSQDGKKPATPPYHTSVNLIVSQVEEKLRASLEDCIQLLDSDLSLSRDYNSFDQYKYKTMPVDEREDVSVEQAGIRSECSNKHWLRSRVDLALKENAREEERERDRPIPDEISHSKRSQFMLKYPVDPNQLLNPFGYYNENAEIVPL